MHPLTQFERYLAPTGRILMGLFFVFAGIGKVGDIGGTAAYIASVGLPMPAVLALLALVIEIAGGIMLITGFYGRYAALLLALFVLVVTFPFHGPSTWADNPTQQIMFMKNIAIMGALIFMAAHIGKAAIPLQQQAEKSPIPTL